MCCRVTAKVTDRIFFYQFAKYLYFCIFKNRHQKMEKSTQAKIYEWASYLLIIGATVYFFVSGKELTITMMGIILALFCRTMVSRTRCRMFEEENEELKVDLRRLTNLLEIEKKKKNDNSNNQ